MDEILSSIRRVIAQDQRASLQKNHSQEQNPEGHQHPQNPFGNPQMPRGQNTFQDTPQGIFQEASEGTSRGMDARSLESRPLDGKNVSSNEKVLDILELTNPLNTLDGQTLSLSSAGFFSAAQNTKKPPSPLPSPAVAQTPLSLDKPLNHQEKGRDQEPLVHQEEGRAQEPLAQQYAGEPSLINKPLAQQPHPLEEKPLTEKPTSSSASHTDAKAVPRPPSLAPQERTGTMQEKDLLDIFKSYHQKEHQASSSNNPPSLSDTSSLNPATGFSATTLEDIALKALMPYIKFWLDNYFPEIAQKAIKKEVEQMMQKRFPPPPNL